MTSNLLGSASTCSTVSGESLFGFLPFSQLFATLVYTWGRGEDGQLGLGDTNDQVIFYPKPHSPLFLWLQYTPAAVEALRDKSVKMVACGSGHTVVLSGARVNC